MASKFGSLFVDLIARTAGFETDMGRAARIAEQRSKQIQKSIDAGFKGALGSVTAFASGLVGGLVSAQAAIQGFMNAINQADRLDELSNRLGISTEQLSEWGYAAKLSGSDLESLTGSLQKFSKNVAEAADAGSNQARLFDALGIKVKDTEGNLRDIEDLLPEVADRFKALNNDTTETALAMELFGRSGAELLEFLNKGSSGLKQLGDEARELGGVIDGQTAAAAAQFNDELDKLRVVVNGLFAQLARELLPTMTALVKQFSDGAKEGKIFGASVTDIGTAIKSVTEFLSGMYAGLEQSIRALRGLQDVFLSVRTAAVDLVNLDFSKMGQNFEKWVGGIRQFWSNVSTTSPADFSGVTATVSGARAQNPRGGSNRPETGGPLMQGDINAYLAGTDKASKKAAKGLSDAEKEAQKLDQTYQSLVASMEQQIALFGKTGEEAKIRYDIENGELQKLNASRQQELIVLAQRIDAQKMLKDLQDAADEAVQREQAAIKEGRRQTDELISDMQFENSLLSMNNVERAKAIALRYADANATDEQRAAIGELAEEYVHAQQTADLWMDVQRGLSDAIVDLVSGSKSAKEAITDFFDALNERILRAIADNWAEQLASLFKNSAGSQSSASASGGNEGGGWIQAIGSLVSSYFGGARAMGGPVNARTPYLIGERGPELFMPSVSGRVIPNNQISAMGGVTVNQTFVNPVLADRRSESQRQTQAARNLRQATTRNG